MYVWWGQGTCWGENTSSAELNGFSFSWRNFTTAAIFHHFCCFLPRKGIRKEKSFVWNTHCRACWKGEEKKRVKCSEFLIVIKNYRFFFGGKFGNERSKELSYDNGLVTCTEIIFHEGKKWEYLRTCDRFFFVLVHKMYFA